MALHIPCSTHLTTHLCNDSPPPSSIYTHLLLPSLLSSIHHRTGSFTLISLLPVTYSFTAISHLHPHVSHALILSQHSPSRARIRHALLAHSFTPLKLQVGHLPPVNGHSSHYQTLPFQTYIHHAHAIHSCLAA